MTGSNRFPASHRTKRLGPNEGVRNNDQVKQLRRALEDYLYDLNPDLDLPLEAAHALIRGLDSQALRELAGQSPDAIYEVRELVPSVIEELQLALTSLPEATFDRAREVAHAYLTGSVRFTAAATRVTDLLYGEEYLGFADRPDTTYPECEDLWRLNEWLDAARLGHSNVLGYLFESPDAAERYFAGLARAWTDIDEDR